MPEIRQGSMDTLPGSVVLQTDGTWALLTSGGATTPGGSDSTPLIVRPSSSSIRRVSVTPTISTLIYAAGDVIGGRMEFDLTGENNNGLLSVVNIYDNDNEKAAGTLWFFDTQPPVITDNNPFTPDATALRQVFYRLTVGAADYVTVNSRAHAQYAGLNVPYAGAKLWMYFVAAATPTYAANNDLTFSLTVVKS